MSNIPTTSSRSNRHLGLIESALFSTTSALLVPALVIGFLSLQLSDGAFDFFVANRYLAGERIYHEMEYFSTPLAVYWNAALLALGPPSIVVIRLAALASCLILALTLTTTVYRQTFEDPTLTWLFFLSALYMGVYHWPTRRIAGIPLSS